MQFLLLTLGGGAARLAGKPKKKGKSKSPELDVAQAAARRTSSGMEFDVRVRNIGGHPLRGLKLFIEVLDAGKRVLTRQAMEIEDEELPAEEQYYFAAQMHPHAGAVYFRIYFEDVDENEVLAAKLGPFAIE